MPRIRSLSFLSLCAPLLLLASSRSDDDLDRFIRAELARRQIPGLSLAVIQDGKIVEARAYGVIEKGGTAPVTPATLFQAGSISKSVAAAGALRLVEQGKISLDGNVNAMLTSWKVPENAFTAAKPVTLRGILSHTAGLTVHGFPGYPVDQPAATLVQVLDGNGPANTAPIRVDTLPGSIWRYSGGGYTVMQQMIVDLTRRPYPDFMRETVLEPFGMRSSSYEQPPPPAKAALTATGHYQDRSLVKGRWHVYPEMAAAGLWTTPSDLARFAIGIQRTLAGKSHAVISQAMARQMVTDQMNGDGLGVFLRGSGPAVFFGHNGRDEGFDAMMTASAERGQGLVVMINANDNSGMVGRITRFVARRYHWPDSGPTVPAVTRDQSITAAMLRAAAGRYELHNNDMITFAANDTALSLLTDGLPDEELIPEPGDRYGSRGGPVRFTLVRDGAGEVTGLKVNENGRERLVPRVGPLVEALRPGPDPDPELTARLPAIMDAIRQGGDALQQAPTLTPGARKDFAAGMSVLTGMRDLRFLGAESAAGRGIERHGAPVARIAYYSVTTDSGKHFLMVHLTAEGAVTDTDLVDN